MRRQWACLALFLLPQTLWADVRPHALCSDGMVLQQKSKVTVWGKADPGEKVTVDFRGQSVSEVADQDGNWRVTLESGEPGPAFEMKLAGKNTLNYKNVAVGEVWICSGQSNMEWTLNQCGGSDLQKAKAAEPNPLLRMYTVRRTPQLSPQSDTQGSWVEAAPNAVGSFSAVGYYFARDLVQDLKVPVGMIHTSWGGTRAEAWTKKETLDANPLFKGEHERLGKEIERSKTEPNAKGFLHQNTASALYNGMVAPLLNVRFRGAIWYQGESNAGQAYNYRTLFPLMIENWRQDFKQGDFPFYFVQLAPFTPIATKPGGSDWAELREAQALTLKLPNTGMAVITDIGSEHDIHPTPKEPVGERLARIARAKVYGEKIEYSGPTLRDAKFDGNKAILTFDHAEGGLVSKKFVPTNERPQKNGTVLAEWRVQPGSEGADVTAFAVAGKDEVFHPAQAKIAGNTVIVSSDAVAEPIAVRYGWANHPLCNLFNRDGLPASPFRTDHFKGVTQR